MGRAFRQGSGHHQSDSEPEKPRSHVAEDRVPEPAHPVADGVAADDGKVQDHPGSVGDGFPHVPRERLNVVGDRPIAPVTSLTVCCASAPRLTTP